MKLTCFGVAVLLEYFLWNLNMKVVKDQLHDYMRQKGNDKLTANDASKVILGVA